MNKLYHYEFEAKYSRTLDYASNSLSLVILCPYPESEYPKGSYPFIFPAKELDSFNFESVTVRKSFFTSFRTEKKCRLFSLLLGGLAGPGGSSVHNLKGRNDGKRKLSDKDN